jgi:hypothetical protein
MYERLGAALTNARFFPPATAEQIARVEKALEFQFPDWLRELYLRTNGISGDHAVYLYALEKNDDFPESLLSWNRFNRDLWQENIEATKQNQPQIDWDALDPQNLLIVGSDNGLDWAIQREGRRITLFDVRNPDDRQPVGGDLVEACVEHERRERETHEALFRGREIYRPKYQSRSEKRDIDLLFEVILALHAPPDCDPHDYRSSWYFDRAISQRPGESGQLFIITIESDQIRIATRDGNLPFAMRLTAWPMEQELSCTVRVLKDALMHILAAKDAISLPWASANERPRPDESELRRIWRTIGPPDPQLLDMAELLFRRDDRRRTDENRLGG